jgi:hypothetical protein
MPKESERSEVRADRNPIEVEEKAEEEMQSRFKLVSPVGSW